MKPAAPTFDDPAHVTVIKIPPGITELRIEMRGGGHGGSYGGSAALNTLARDIRLGQISGLVIAGIYLMAAYFMGMWPW